jgi:C4-dicarboxylate transporter DctM subunit
MARAGYDRGFAASIAVSAGVLGPLIPPSIAFVIWGIVATIKKLPRQPRAGWGERLRTGREALWGLLLIIIILGGIYGGIFTPTEAAAVAAVYAFLIAVFVYRDLKLRDVGRVLVDSARVTVMLLFIISNAMLFAHVLTTEQIPQVIASEILSAGLAPWQFLIVVNLLLLVAGNFMEPSAIILILAPILFPIAIKLGVDPIHLGVIMVVNMEIGMVTPPVGLNLFVTSGITGMGVLQVVRAAWPWLMVLLAFLVIVTYVPWLSLVLPNALFGNAIVQ